MDNEKKDNRDQETKIEVITEPEIEKSNIILASEVLPDTLCILPITSRPVFPGMVLPLVISNEAFSQTFEKIVSSDIKVIGLILTKDPNIEDEKIDESKLFRVGTAVKILKYAKTEAGFQLLINAVQRFEVKRYLAFEPVITAKVHYYPEEYDKHDEELKAMSIAIVNLLKELVKHNPLFSEELKIMLSRANFEEYGKLADFSAALTSSEREALQEILETFDIKQRMAKVFNLLRKEMDLTKLKEKISSQIEEKISKQQREFFLREQLKAIKQELGMEKDEKTILLEKFEKRIKELKLTKEAKEKVEETLERLRLEDPRSPEFGVQTNYIEWLIGLPWGIYSEDIFDIDRARKILNRDHYGLEEIKERILEFIAVAKLKGEITGSILLFVGPPGVGKTSLGASIARALGRKFFRFSVGGMRDEAEIKGHRRTYIGAMPGKIIQAMKLTGTQNPVIMLDEIDKIGNSFHGDPASALLEVLDPEQNREFLDHYIDVRFDLSKVLFIATANMTDTIPPALLDRMEVMKLSGYITEEKIEIAKRYLIPKKIKEAGLTRSDISIGKKELKKIIDQYAREAGVRALEQKIATITRKVAKEIVEKGKKVKRPVKITSQNIKKYLGNPIFTDEMFRRRLEPGVVTGLAWTSMGGATLYIEAIKIKSEKSGFKQSGQLGDVMVESSDIAYSFARANISRYGGDESFFDKALIHLHVPAGATPKDGPSAGITMTTSLLSLALGKRVKRDIAMTGEMTLTGRVLPVGGIREKVVAAIRAGIKKVILPIDNKKDFDELPDYIKKSIKVYYATHYDDVFNIVFKEENKK